jgi:hypothetical protein
VLTAETKAASMRLNYKSWLQLAQRNKFDCFDDMDVYFEELGEDVLENIKHDATNYLRH